DAPDPGRCPPDLHPRPARPCRRVHHRDLRPRRRGNQAQSDRERLPATDPRHIAELDLGPVSDRLARLTGAVTPTHPDYADATPASNALTRNNSPAGRITQPST